MYSSTITCIRENQVNGRLAIQRKELTLEGMVIHTGQPFPSKFEKKVVLQQ
jgi:hypothetical protein